MAEALLLALDQGTTSTRAIAYDAASLAPRGSAQQELPQHFPAPGWVEHEAEDIWQSTLATLRGAKVSSRANKLVGHGMECLVRVLARVRASVFASVCARLCALKAPLQSPRGAWAAQPVSGKTIIEG